MGPTRCRSKLEGEIDVLEQDQIDNLMGRDIYGSDGAKIGTAVQVYADDETGQPEWVTVRTGLFGTKESFVPLADASVSGDRITVQYDKAFVKDAPSIDEEGHLSEDQEQELYPTTTAAMMIGMTPRLEAGLGTTRIGIQPG